MICVGTKLIDTRTREEYIVSRKDGAGWVLQRLRHGNRFGFRFVTESEIEYSFFVKLSASHVIRLDQVRRGAGI